ncbi:flagellar protein MotY [Pseudomonas citronellolis]|uniref:flagellar protein MotY n=1 Tax=Pseudomonas citronellolis TaxID=53408 RepID=UPI0023E375C2|nr:OmpA family protein [Pseudomonas citronellolis]MDF3934307.1 OmpA family protein [Pseudomonas citronellolis]
MRHSYLLLLGLCASLPTWGLTFQTRLENAQWTAAGDQFECRLSQQVAGFGVGEFVWRAGEQPTFRLKPQRNWLGGGSATLLAAAAPWRPAQGDINLGSVSLVAGEVPFTSSQQQAGRLLDGVLEGRSPEVRLRSTSGQDLRVRLLPTRFADGYAQLQDCSAKMLAVNFEQIRQAQVGFPGGGDALDDVAKAKLDIILQYLKADPTVNRIELDGHSDNAGNRLSNRDISRRRAVAVMEYLKANGVPENQITVRFYGERYPLAKNNTEANRARNRRVTVHLSREALQEAPPPSVAPNATPPATPAPAQAAPQAKAPAGNLPASAPLGQSSARGA